MSNWILANKIGAKPDEQLVFGQQIRRKTG
jgi:hypothetical protein